MNKVVLYISVALILIFAGIFLQPKIMDTNKPYVRINSLEIPVEIAADYTTRAKGLSGRASLAQNSGMLFVFDKPAIHSFWMPDMNFSIDIIWINDNKVVDISKNVPNDFSLLNIKTYKPSQPAKYVLEVNAGFSERKNIKIGDTVSIQNYDL